MASISSVILVLLFVWTASSAIIFQIQTSGGNCVDVGDVYLQASSTGWINQTTLSSGVVAMDDASFRNTTYYLYRWILCDGKPYKWTGQFAYADNSLGKWWGFVNGPHSLCTHIGVMCTGGCEIDCNDNLFKQDMIFKVSMV